MLDDWIRPIFLYIVSRSDDWGTNLGRRRLKRTMQMCNPMSDNHDSLASTLGVVVRLELLHARQTDCCGPLPPLQGGPLPVSCVTTRRCACGGLVLGLSCIDGEWGSGGGRWQRRWGMAILRASPLVWSPTPKSGVNFVRIGQKSGVGRVSFLAAISGERRRFNFEKRKLDEIRLKSDWI
jgi:hypothetical protein